MGDLALNQASRELRRAGQWVELTSTEFSILALLLQRSGEVVEKKDIYLAALGREPVAYDRSIDMHVSNLRRKLGPAETGGTGLRPYVGSVTSTATRCSRIADAKTILETVFFPVAEHHGLCRRGRLDQPDGHHAQRR